MIENLNILETKINSYQLEHNIIVIIYILNEK